MTSKNESEVGKFPPTSTTLAAFLENDDGDGNFRQMIYGLHHLSSMMLKTREQLGARIGVTGPQYSILVVIAENGCISVGELANKLHVSSPFITASTRDLIQRGYIEKRPSAGDRRLNLLSIAAAGRNAILSLADIRRQANDRAFANLSRSEAQHLQRLVKILVVQLEQVVHWLDAPGALPNQFKATN